MADIVAGGGGGAVTLDQSLKDLGVTRPEDREKVGRVAESTDDLKSLDTWVQLSATVYPRV